MANGAILGQTANTYSKEQIMASSIPALYGLSTDATPSDVLEKLSGAALINKTGGEPLRTETALSSLPVGTRIYSDESNDWQIYTTSVTDYLQTGSLILMTISTYQNYWSSNGQSTYQNSDLDKYAQSLKLPSRVQSNLVSLPIPVDGTTLNRSVFAFSATEVGVTNYSPPVEGKNIVGSTLKNIVTRNSWLRTTQTNDTPYAYWFSQSYGGVDRKNSYTHDYVFGVSVSKTLKVYLDDDGKYYFEQKYTPVDTKLTDVLGQYIGNAIKIVTGSYTGTGTYGSSNPNSLTFEFKPKIVVIEDSFGSAGGYVWINEANSGRSTESSNCVLNWEANSLKWYNGSSVVSQLNSSGVKYLYFILG